MTRSTRREFLRHSAEGLAGLAAAGRLSAAPANAGQRLRVLYSNDTTNITSCKCPFRQPGEPFGDKHLIATIDEARGVDAHLLQPGLGWVPWWQSKVYDGAKHYQDYERDFGIRVNEYGRYLAAGGDLIRTHSERCRQLRVAPFVSFRLNDAHQLDAVGSRDRRAVSASKFYREHYQHDRIGSDMQDWSQRVLNWAVPAVREHKFALIREICGQYDIDGLELDFMRQWSYFRLDETPPEARREIMRTFVARVREALDQGAAAGQQRLLCVRIPAHAEAHERLGTDVTALRTAGVDIFNLSDSYFTTQDTDLAAIRAAAPEAGHYLEMTHTTATGKPLAGSGSSVFRRTTDEQFYTTAHLAYARGAAGVSLFNFAYFREHVMPELGPFSEPPFHVLPWLGQPEWLAQQPQWYFLSALPNKPPISDRPLPVIIKPQRDLTFRFDMAPTAAQQRDGLLRIMADQSLDGARFEVDLNGVRLAASEFVSKPIDHPYEGFLGAPEQFACFHCPRKIARDGINEAMVRLIQGPPAKLTQIEITLP